MSTASVFVEPALERTDQTREPSKEDVNYYVNRGVE